MCEICGDSSFRSWSHARNRRHLKLLIKKFKQEKKIY